ncbi:MAG: phosphonate C-P lyase system protein PhnH [Syntrophomonadaceae bacterium]|nr:phosphonate C-P lyase system protein PhnH [Syntrophomonadaceae bacterium]
MELDLVHDIQAVYRKVIDSMSKPGLISNVRSQAEKVTLTIGCFNTTLLLILMLLDTEIKFKVCSEHEEEVTQAINRLTYARATELENADFIIVLHDAPPRELVRALRRAYAGDLLNPHKSATIIFEADAVTNAPDLILTGPGIEKENRIRVNAGSDEWVDLRAEKNSEYPLGIEIIITDPDDNILCLPRTTQITRQVMA